MIGQIRAFERMPRQESDAKKEHNDDREAE